MPLTASEPVSAIEKPIVIGLPAGAAAGAASAAAELISSTASTAASTAPAGPSRFVRTFRRDIASSYLGIAWSVALPWLTEPGR